MNGRDIMNGRLKFIDALYGIIIMLPSFEKDHADCTFFHSLAWFLPKG